MKVLLSFDLEKDLIVFIVADNGQGMRSKQIESIFSFNQLKPKERVDGRFQPIKLERETSVGLGLYISNQIIRTNEG